MSTNSEKAEKSREEKYRAVLAEAVKNNRNRSKKTKDPQVELNSLLPEVDNTIPDGMIAMSDKFGVEPTGRDVPVKVYEDEDWPEHIRMFIPKPIEGYVWDVEALTLTLLGLEARDRILYTGVAGTGKSTIVEQVCAKLRIPFMRVNCREDMESSAIFGSIHVENGTLGWIPGPAEELGRHGGVLQIDEIASSPPGINMSMQWMLEDNGKIFLADKPGTPEEKIVDPCDRFWIVATDNTRLQGDTSGSFAGTQVQNFAMLDRFSNVIEMDYPDRKLEIKMIQNRVPEIKKELAEKMVQVAGHIRAAYKEGSIQYPLSPRGNLLWGWKIVQTGSIETAFRHVYFMKLIDDDRRQVAEYYSRIFPDAKL